MSARHAAGECGNDCCRRGDGIATPYRTLYEREQQHSADLRRQLDQAWRRLNVQGEILREQGLDTAGLDEHIDHLAAIQRHTEHQVQQLEAMRLTVITLVEDAYEQVRQRGAKLTPLLVVLEPLRSAVLKANTRAKDTPSMRDCRAEVAAAREKVPEPRDPALEEELHAPSLFDVGEAS
ncbi:hypothetical protein [Tsukamurella tyrosinosolvens]|uniref:hypothetical protein n=1 Tax=Tsukamurella tyrosinosolvens TaxID=57704 RepID=UPI000DF6D7F1|nr:hypothetical protein [Tsukamurella tyrosinosolvens]RDB46159.1 hypothetical protein DVB87_19495 [Tsukamurella tyrosinosolvens]